MFSLAELSEAEKLAKMTKEEKAQYMQQKKEKELTDREAAITRKELMAEAKNTLASDGLPQELAEVLDYSDADTCKKSMEKVKEVFQRAVETAVEEKLKGGKPPKKAPGGDAQKALYISVIPVIISHSLKGHFRDLYFISTVIDHTSCVGVHPSGCCFLYCDLIQHSHK